MKKRYFRDSSNQQDLFVCEIQDLPFKDEMESMSHPFYALSSKPSDKIFKYKNGDAEIEITPSGLGMATIHDKDVLIYCISLAVNEFNLTGEVPKEIVFHSYDLLQITGRGTGGASYQRLENAFTRLRGTEVKTTIRNGDTVIKKGQGLIDNWTIAEKSKSGRVISSKVTLSDWTIEGIKNQKVKTLDHKYFLLKRPIDKRLYEIVRRHIGNHETWQISLENLHLRTGSSSKMFEFRRLINESVKSDHLPEFSIKWDEKRKDILLFKKRRNAPTVIHSGLEERLSPNIMEKARAAAPKYDVYYLLEEWKRFWLEEGKPIIKNPDKAFIAFCKKRYEKNPNP